MHVQRQSKFSLRFFLELDDGLAVVPAVPCLGALDLAGSLKESTPSSDDA